MFIKISILIILLLTTINVKAGNTFIDESSQGRNCQYSSRPVTVSVPEQGLEIVNHTTGERFTVPSRPGEVILRTLNNMYRFTQYHNFAGPYNAIEVFAGREFAAIDLGVNKYSLNQVYIQGDRLFLTMLNGDMYSYYNHRLEAFEFAQP